MGATSFTNFVEGVNAQEAFDTAVTAARWENGHGGYTGTIAEKHRFVLIRESVADVRAQLVKYAAVSFTEQSRALYIEALDKADTPRAKALAIARALMVLQDGRVEDKWGPAGCIPVEGQLYLFFGMASQ